MVPLSVAVYNACRQERDDEMIRYNALIWFLSLLDKVSLRHTFPFHAIFFEFQRFQRQLPSSA
jgi:hypothetical protein